jgi:hypothetical protein
MLLTASVTTSAAHPARVDSKERARLILATAWRADETWLGSRTLMEKGRASVKRASSV